MEETELLVADNVDGPSIEQEVFCTAASPLCIWA